MKASYRTTALMVVLVMSMIGGFVGAQSGHLMVAPADLKWEDGPPTIPPGAKIALMYGDPRKAEPFAYRLKFPADYKVMPHWHPVDAQVTVLSGTLYVGIGDEFEAAKGQALPAGSFLLMPAKTHHFEYTKEETILQNNAIGPFGITYLNPADDPSKKTGQR